MLFHLSSSQSSGVCLDTGEIQAWNNVQIRPWFSSEEKTDKYQVPQKAESQTRWWKDLRTQEMMEVLGLAFFCLFQQDMQIPPSWHHYIISPHQCLMTQSLSIALSQHHCAISSWPCKKERKSVHDGRKLWPASQEVPNGIQRLLVILWTLLPGNNMGSENSSVKWHSTVLWRSSHSRWKSS